MRIEYKNIEFELKALTEIKLPDFKGSAFRGGFGHIFRKITCVLKRLNCLECPLKNQCIYSYVFETPPLENSNILNMSNYEKIPHPFIFEPPETKKKLFQPEETLNLKILLIGKAMEFAPYFIYTISELGKVGIGKGRGKFTVENINIGEKLLFHLNNINIRESYSVLKIRAITPLRIKYNRDLVRDIEFHILIRSLLRRLSLIYYFHIKPEILIHEPKELIRKAETVKKVQDITFWYDWERYSSRQDKRMKLGGVIGEIIYKGNISIFIPYVKAGEILHVGKGTSFGLGKYEIVEFSS